MIDERSEIEAMFPTGVGMNRDRLVIWVRPVYVPHRRGDEPHQYGVKAMRNVCSPQAWG